MPASSSAPATPDASFEPLLATFAAMPGASLLLSPQLTIVAASADYLQATLTKWSHLQGRYLFDVFPGNPHAAQGRAEHNLRSSLAQVLATGQPHEMELQHYDVPDPEFPGRFVERHWLPRNMPVLDAQGRVRYIIHTVTNVTESVRATTLLRESLAQEEEAQTDADAQRQRLHEVLVQLPACIATHHGPAHVFDFVNPRFKQLFPGRRLRGRPLRQALPELAGQQYFELFDKVYQSGEAFYGTEMETWVDFSGTGRLERRYFNVFVQALRDGQGQIDGLLNFGYDVTELVLSRRQTERGRELVQNLNEKLASTNAELQAANEEFLANNMKLLGTQLQLRQLNQELESRVQERTMALQLARQASEQQRLRLERLFMEAPAAICVLSGPELVFELVNPGYQQLFPGRELLGRPIVAALPEIAGHAVMATFRRVYKTGLTHQEQALLIPLARPGDGRLEDRYFNFIQQARFNEHGHVDGVLVFAFEVTGQVQARQAAEASARQLRLVTDALPVLIGYLDREEKYRFANQAYRAWFNQDPGRLLGRPVREVLGEKAYAGVAGYIRRALAGERVSFNARMPYREDFVKHIHSSYVPDVRDGAVQGFFTLVTDVTEQELARQQVLRLNDELAVANLELQKANRELSATNQQLARTNVDLDNFIYAASHDLKGPITNIEGLLHVLAEQLPSPANPELGPVMAMMHDSVTRFQRTLDMLSDVTKLQKAHGQPATDVPLAALIKDVCHDLQPLIEHTGARLDVDFDNCLSVAFPPQNLRSVVYNLLSNALKFHHPGRAPHVRLRCRQTEAHTVLEVQDNGLGLDESQQAELFTMFRRLHTHVDGSGIGLYMVKRSVENAGGQVMVTSAPGVGTTFSVFFRREPLPPASPPGAPGS